MPIRLQSLAVTLTDSIAAGRWLYAHPDLEEEEKSLCYMRGRYISGVHCHLASEHAIVV